MKEKNINTISKIILLCTCLLLVALLSTQKDDNDSRPTTSTHTSTNPITSTTKTNGISLSSDEFYIFVEDTCKKHTQNTDFEIYKINTLRIPYYEFRFVSTKEMTTEEFETQALQISENIYDSLIQKDYYLESIFSPSREIISLDFYIKCDSHLNGNIIVQFDLTDIDKNKDFKENLKLLG